MCNTYRIVIADDNADVRFCLRRLLEHAGHCVVAEARSGKELIERSSSIAHDLIITDIKMPGVDGLAAVHVIMKSRETPVVVVSAYFDDDLINRANSCGVFSYLIKPIRHEELLATAAVVVQRFQEFQLLRHEAIDARQALENRKDIERAKGIIMKKCNLDEPEAFCHLQHLARTRREKMIDVARSILLAHEVFDMTVCVAAGR